MTIAFDSAFEAKLNGGIVGALVSMNTVFIIIAAYCMFGEKLNKVKSVAIIFLVTSVILVSLFTPD